MSETVENLSTLKINYLTQEQYDAAVSSGIIQENELYLTPTSGEQSALPSGGLMGQVLAKSSDDDYAVAWTTVQSGETLPIIKKNIINNGTYTFELSHNNIYSGPSTIEDDEFYPNVGDIINITWDGVKYTCVVKDESYGYPYIGSYSINSGTPGDYPFFIAWIQSMDRRQFDTLDTASSHTIYAFSVFEENTPLAIKNQEWKPSYCALLPQTNQFLNILTDDAVTLEEFESGIYYTQIYSYQFYQPNDGDTIHILAKESDYKVLDVDETLHEVSRLSYYAGELDQENYYSYRIVLEPETFGNGISITFYSYDSSITYLSISIGTPDNTIIATYNGKWVQTTLADIGSGLTLPSGGSTGQVLAKSSNDDYAVAWATTHDIPAGGSTGQVLAKSSDDNYALAWATPSGGSDKVMVVTITYSSTYPYYSSNKTIDEIITAIDNGYDVYLIYTGSYSGAAHEIYQLHYRSTTDVYFIRMNVSSGSIREDYFRIYKSNNDTLVTKSNYYASIPPQAENQYYIVIKYADSENKYYIDDYLSLSYLAYLDLTSGFYRFGSVFAYYSEEGDYLPGTGTYEDRADYYYLQKYWNTEKYDEGDGSYNSISHVIFSKIDNTNGTVKLKSFLIEGGSWDSIQDATVTYSEVSLGQPSPAAGVGF